VKEANEAPLFKLIEMLSIRDRDDEACKKVSRNRASQRREEAWRLDCDVAPSVFKTRDEVGDIGSDVRCSVDEA
jgi:hypothetical protein